MPPDTDQIAISSNGRRRGKLKLLSRESLDRRLLASKRFSAIASGIAQDLGGEDRLTTIQRALVESFAGIAIHVDDLNARVLLGQQIDVVELSQVVSTMVRIATRLGINRVARDVPDLNAYLASLPKTPTEAA
jgi:hypothetical protein